MHWDAAGTRRTKLPLWADTVRDTHRERPRDRKSRGETEIPRGSEIETERQRHLGRVRDSERHRENKGEAETPRQRYLEAK